MSQNKIIPEHANSHIGYSHTNECWFVRFYGYATEEQAKQARAQLEQAGGQGWRDINSAPRDGSSILLGGYFDGKGFMQRVGVWDDRIHEWRIGPDVVGRGFTNWQNLPAPAREGEAG